MILNEANRQVERITADEIRAGDRVARSRGHTFRSVKRVELLNVAVRIHYANGSTDRPQQTAKWWREVADAAYGVEVR